MIEDYVNDSQDTVFIPEMPNSFGQLSYSVRRVCDFGICEEIVIQSGLVCQGVVTVGFTVKLNGCVVHCVVS